MSSRPYIPEAVRRRVKQRANASCEYCLIPELFSDAIYHIDHVISIRQTGSSELSNLAYSCPTCNYYKGTNLSAYIADRELIVELFNPRLDDYSKHFKLLGTGKLEALSDKASGTIILLKLNSPAKTEERRLLIIAGVINTSK